MAPGFLVAFSEPGTHVSHEEFQDWYDNEHIPLRLHLPSFLTGARFSASDSKTPTWLALYDVIDTSALSDPSYTRLRASRSKREADLVLRLQVLDRRTCVLIQDSGESGVTTSLGAERPTQILCTHGLDVGDDDDETGRWAEQRFEALGRDVDGWVRTRVFKVLDNSTSTLGTAIEKAQTSPYFVVHEFTSPAASLNPAFREVVDKPSVSELREWVLYKAYPSIAQGKSPAVSAR